MYKKYLIIVSLISCLLPLSEAFGREGFYIGGHIGPSLLEDADLSFAPIEFDEGFGLGGAVGYEFEQIRIEGEITYRSNDIDNINGFFFGGDIDAVSYLINGFVDFETGNRFKPYIGAGIGVSDVEINPNADTKFPVDFVTGGDNDDTVFSYQLVAGLRYAVSEPVTLDLSYRYFATAGPEFGPADFDYINHNVFLGISFMFK